MTQHPEHVLHCCDWKNTAAELKLRNLPALLHLTLLNLRYLVQSATTKIRFLYNAKNWYTAFENIKR